ncbi:MAG: hypothetical protein Q8L71_00635 [Thiobacillus sp.]|nr:hypothetical protein [Thiobacillus sp.]
MGRHVPRCGALRRAVAGQSGEQRAGRIERARTATARKFVFGHYKGYGFSVTLDGEVLRVASLRGNGLRGGGRCCRRGAIQMECEAADQGGGGDRAHHDAGWGECRGEQQAEQADTTGSCARS